jgi:hypothetical protein
MTDGELRIAAPAIENTLSPLQVMRRGLALQSRPKQPCYLGSR